MLQSIKEDLYRDWGEDCTSFRNVFNYLLKPHTRYMFYLRHAQNGGKFRFVWITLCLILKYKSGVQIPPETKIGRGFRFLHFGSVVVNPRAEIGDNFNMAQNTLIGESFIDGVCGVPKIGNNVCMFANSVIVGGGASA